LISAVLSTRFRDPPPISARRSTWIARSPRNLDLDRQILERFVEPWPWPWPWLAVAGWPWPWPWPGKALDLVVILGLHRHTVVR
jgi:hypothetical protein